ncbi:MAG: hypothetical protein ABIS50_11585 [Luteolibacter sp.]|uniref:hypothetical protein n=1 Tax=Luteolibacter sp. TaxID=1962973 RepID=UPI003265E7CB
MSEIGSLTPAALDFEPVMRGDTFPARPLAMLSQDGAAVEVTSALLQVRTRLRQTLVTEWKTSDDSILISGSPTPNIITLAEKPAAETAEWPLGRHDYDLEITLADGRVITLFKGDFPVNRDTSRSA